LQAAINAGFHIAMVDEFPTVGLFNAPLDISADLRILLDHTQSGLLYQLLGGSAAVVGQLRNLPD
jgi:hypothetical protein